MKLKRKNTTIEELANTLTHGVGAFIAMVGLVILVVIATYQGGVKHVVSFSIFGGMMVVLYSISTLYHGTRKERLKKVFRMLDHMSIYLFIAASYTPFCLLLLKGPFQWAALGMVWTCAILGVVMKGFHTGKKEVLSTILYIAMGWISIVVIKPLFNLLSVEGFVLLMGGGLLYTLGTIFYLKENMKYNHTVWHLFVLGGSTLHYFSVLTLV